MSGLIMNLELTNKLEKLKNNLIEKHNPLAIIIKGSRMFGIENLNSDYDICLITKNLEKNYQVFDENLNSKIDIFFTTPELEVYGSDFFKGISLLQNLFVRPEHILYMDFSFDFIAFKNKIKEKKEKLILNQIQLDLLRIETFAYNFKNKKDYYHYCYLSSLLSTKEPNW
ncbi:Uncharacterised protein, partial [Metamycoplasma alkalescens]